MLPALIAALFVLSALAASAYAIHQAGAHASDVRDATLLLLVLGGLVAALGTAALLPDQAVGRGEQTEMQGVRA